MSPPRRSASRLHDHPIHFGSPTQVRHLQNSIFFLGRWWCGAAGPSDHPDEDRLGYAKNEQGAAPIGVRPVVWMGDGLTLRVIRWRALEWGERAGC